MALTAKGQPNGLATLDSSGNVTGAQFVTAAAIADLAMTVGTADNTLADVGASFNQTTLNNNMRDLGEKVNAILAALRAAGIVASS